MTTTITITRDDKEIEVDITGNYHPRVRGARDGRYGPPIEPDEPECVEFEEATYNDKSIELTEDEVSRAEDALWQEVESARADAAESRADARRDDE